MAKDTKVDIIVFGASGFTGKFVVKELAALQSSRSNSQSFTFGIAGRSVLKLNAVLSDIFGDKPEASKVPIIEADVSDPSSLAKMAQSAKIILNCVGPYRFFGEPVVEACVAAGTDYLDITGEPEFVEKMYLKYHQKAVEKRVVVISTCGFDSIPADMGVLYALSQLDSDMIPSAIESYIHVDTTSGSSFKGHYTTFESAVHGFSQQAELKRIRRQIKYPRLPIFGPKQSTNILPRYDERLMKWTVPFPGSDASVVRRTQLSLMKEEGYHPTQYSAYFTLSSMFQVVCLVLFGMIFALMTKFEFGKRLLLKHPELFTAGRFSHQGPSKEEIASTFFTMTFFLCAYSSDPTAAQSQDKPVEKMLLTTRLTGPEPGYVLTPMAITQAALCLLQNKGKTIKKVGVLTPGTAFYGSDYMSRLHERGLKMSVVEKKRVSA